MKGWLFFLKQFLPHYKLQEVHPAPHLHWRFPLYMQQLSFSGSISSLYSCLFGCLLCNFREVTGVAVVPLAKVLVDSCSSLAVCECAVAARLGSGAVSSAHYTPTCGLTSLGLGLLGTEGLNTLISVLKLLTFKHHDSKQQQQKKSITHMLLMASWSISSHPQIVVFSAMPLLTLALL